MNGYDDDREIAEFASPPCLMHEVDPGYVGIDGAGGQKPDPVGWRKSQRARLIERRLAIPAELRRRHDARIAEFMRNAIGDLNGLTVAIYWPFRGEPDLRPTISTMLTEGASCVALPVVVEKNKPLLFRSWAPGDPLRRGVWNIPVPGAEAPIVIPDVVVAPLVGYDCAGFRLGYGGGFYDRTLAALPSKPRVLGVGYTLSAMRTIYPQAHDIPMDVLVTEEGLIEPAPGD